MTQNDQADSDAISWLIALQEEPENQDVRAAFSKWLEHSQQNRQAWAEIEELQAIAEEHGLRGGVDERGPDMDRPAISPPATKVPVIEPPRSTARRFFLPAAAAVIIAALLVQVPAFLLQLQADHITAEGTTREILLADGSTVHLGAGSAITVSFKNGQRAVSLLQGEAFFRVVRDENRPFVVSHGSTRTRVLGTEFEVRETGEGTEVSVVEGAVEVAADGPAGAGQRLSAGRRIRMGDTDEKIQESEAVETAEVAAWRRGELIVDDWTLRQVVDTLDRHYGGTILFDGRSTGKRRISGAYKLDKPVDAVRLIARAQNLNVRELTDWLVVLTPY